MRLTCAALVALCVLAALPATAQTPADPALTTHPTAAPTREPVGAYWNDPKFMEAWKEGLQLNGRHE
jgi:hypothetical protein